MPSDIRLVDAAITAMASRGPDERAVVDVGFASIGVARLAITDPANGHQPLWSASKDLAVIFNGAIYNHVDLKRRYDLVTETENDGEIIHHLYSRFGLEFPGFLEGMFAVCLVDLRRKVLVVAVDSLGIKPLYISRADGRFFVASVLGALPIEYQERAWRVPPGTVWLSDGSSFRYTQRTTKSGELGDLVAESVGAQIPRDVAWGCMLSGGLDSSTIAAIASRIVPSTLTFTVGFEDSADAQVAQRFAEYIGSKHTQVRFDVARLEPLVEQIIEITASKDEYTVLGGIATNLVAEVASNAGVKVLLSGEGADELFGGYDEHLTVPDYALNAFLVHDQIDLGAGECLRLDRATMDKSIEARVPFLNSSVVRHSRALSSSQKIDRSQSPLVRKAALRHAALAFLPDWVRCREKTPMFDGSGLTKIVKAIAEKRWSPSDLSSLKSEYPQYGIHNAMTAWFFSVWIKKFHHLGSSDEDLVSRGLARRPFSLYTPIATDPSTYGELPAA